MELKMNCNCDDDKIQNNSNQFELSEEKKDQNGRNDAVNTFDVVAEMKQSYAKDSSSPSIFKLDIDCCEELFEYLPLADLHSLGQTCKRMYQYTGYFVRENYKSTWFQWEAGKLFQFWSDGSDVNGFIEFISRLSIMSDTLKSFSQFAPEFKSIKELKLDLNGGQIDCLKNLLPKCEKVFISIYHDMFFDDSYNLYDDILKFCPNLTHLKVNVNSMSDFKFEMDNKWMLHKYPKLEYLELYPNSLVKPPIEMIKRFFARNQRIRRLRTNSACLWDIRHWILNTETKLDELSVKFLHLKPIDDQLKEQFTIDLLNVLYDRGFYRQLSLYEVNDFVCDKLAKILIPAAIYMFTCAEISTPIPKFDIKEIGIFALDDTDELESCLKNNISTIERIKIQYLKTFDNILFAIQKAKNLKEINITYLNNRNSLDLITLNRERQKLIGSCKVTINLSRYNYEPKMKLIQFDQVKIKCKQ